MGRLVEHKSVYCVIGLIFFTWYQSHGHFYCWFLINWWKLGFLVFLSFYVLVFFWWFLVLDPVDWGLNQVLGRLIAWICNIGVCLETLFFFYFGGFGSVGCLGLSSGQNCLWLSETRGLWFVLPQFIFLKHFKHYSLLLRLALL